MSLQLVQSLMLASVLAMPFAIHPPFFAALASSRETPQPEAMQPNASHVIDEVGFVDAGTLRQMEGHLRALFHESGADVRFLFAMRAPEDLVTFARIRARELGVGRSSGGRGMLFVYDVSRERLRIEVGPGLEGTFPDGFVGFLMRQQTAAFFASGNRVLGIKSTLFIIGHRLREATLRQAYDPHSVAYVSDPAMLAAGGGASARIPIERKRGGDERTVLSAAARARFAPQQTVARAHARYLEALRDGYVQPDLPLYAPGSDWVLRRFPIAAPYAQFILYSEYGHKYAIVERGNLAMLVFTSTPLVSPHHFRRSRAGWQLDLSADVRNTQESIGGPYTWRMRKSGDDFSLRFSDQFRTFGKFVRLAAGDNRPLPLHTPMP